MKSKAVLEKCSYKKNVNLPALKETPLKKSYYQERNVDLIPPS